MVELLDKDPLAGRHEIIQQEAKKAIRESNLPASHTAGLKLTVKDWATANHTELRSVSSRGPAPPDDSGEWMQLPVLYKASLGRCTRPPAERASSRRRTSRRWRP